MKAPSPMQTKLSSAAIGDPRARPAHGRGHGLKEDAEREHGAEPHAGEHDAHARRSPSRRRLHRRPLCRQWPTVFRIPKCVQLANSCACRAFISSSRSSPSPPAAPGRDRLDYGGDRHEAARHLGDSPTPRSSPRRTGTGRLPRRRHGLDSSWLWKRSRVLRPLWDRRVLAPRVSRTVGLRIDRPLRISRDEAIQSLAQPGRRGSVPAPPPTAPA